MKNIFLIIISVVMLSACNKEDTYEKVEFDKEAFLKNKELWEKAKITDYQFDERFSAEFCGPGIFLTMTVKDGKFVSDGVEDKEKRYPCKGRHYRTINDLFKKIEDMEKSMRKSIDSEDNSMKGGSIEVKYDQQYHFPTEVHFSGHYPEGYIGGLSISVEIKNFKPMKK